MTLAEKIKKRGVKVETIEIDGLRFKVTGKTKRERGELFARGRNSKTTDWETVENVMLEACVSDADDGSTMTAAEWAEAPSHISGPALSVVMSVCGMDKDDLKRDDPKDSGSIES